MKRIVVFLFFLFGLMNLNAQLAKEQSAIMFSGLIFNKETQDSIPGVHIIVNQKTGYISNIYGQFEFNAYPGDTIVMTHVGFRPAVIFIQDTLKTLEYVLAVGLSQDTILLNEVVIRPRINYQRFKYNVLNNYSESGKMLVAKNNIDLTKITSARASQKYTADRITEMKLRSYEHKAMEMGGIPSNQMIGGNFLVLIPLGIAFLKGELQVQEDRSFLKSQEIDLLKVMFKELYQKNSDTLKFPEKK